MLTLSDFRVFARQAGLLVLLQQVIMSVGAVVLLPTSKTSMMGAKILFYLIQTQAQ
jgi:hypothetical protein